MDTIIVPVDGATNIKLEVFDFDTLACVHSESTETPTTTFDGLAYNCTGEECSWFEDAIRRLPEELRTVRVIAPVARGASGGLIGKDGTLIEALGRGLTLAYTQEYHDDVETAFRELAGDECDFFRETGSVRDFPGSLTLLKRFVFEERERPALLDNAARFGTYGTLLAGHFLGPDYLAAADTAGNEHSYWMCHTGARNIHRQPGTPSTATSKIVSFQRLVPREPYPVYRAIGSMPPSQASSMGLTVQPLVVPGGHDTCLSHIPVMSTFYQVFSEQEGQPVIHLDAGSWTMAARIGGGSALPANAHERDVIVQGTVDGDPVVTARYGGGNDFRFLSDLITKRCGSFTGGYDSDLLKDILASGNCFVFPNINPVNRLSGPFPRLEGRIINEGSFYSNERRAHILSNLATAVATSVQVDAVGMEKDVPVVLTAGGSKDPYFGRFVAALTGRNVYALFDGEGGAVSETTSLGAAITGKAACLGIHPYAVDVRGIGLTYREIEVQGDETTGLLKRYGERMIEEIHRNMS